MEAVAEAALPFVVKGAGAPGSVEGGNGGLGERGARGDLADDFGVEFAEPVELEIEERVDVPEDAGLMLIGQGILNRLGERLASNGHASAGFGAGLERNAMGAGEGEGELIFAGNLRELSQQSLDAAVQMEHQLLHERRPGAGFVAEALHCAGKDAEN